MKISDLNKESKYPEFACQDCLFKAGGRLNTNDTLTTLCHCEVCGKRKKCFDPKAFSWPVFSPPAYKGVLDVGWDERISTYQCG